MTATSVETVEHLDWQPSCEANGATCNEMATHLAIHHKACPCGPESRLLCAPHTTFFVTWYRDNTPCTLQCTKCGHTRFAKTSPLEVRPL